MGHPASRMRPILLRIETKAGHGAGKPVTKQIEEFTDVYSFLFWQLGGETVARLRANKQRKPTVVRFRDLRNLPTPTVPCSNVG
jgi:hypothetical protein